MLRNMSARVHLHACGTQPCNTAYRTSCVVPLIMIITVSSYKVNIMICILISTISLIIIINDSYTQY